jgi:hypothetical protein
MKVFEFYSKDGFEYTHSGETENEARAALIEFKNDTDFAIDHAEEIPESKWDEKIIHYVDG